MQRKKERRLIAAGYSAVFASYLVSEKNPFPIFNSYKLMMEREK